MLISFRSLESNLVGVSVYGLTLAVYEAIRRVTFGRRRTPLTLQHEEVPVSQ